MKNAKSGPTPGKRDAAARQPQRQQDADRGQHGHGHRAGRRASPPPSCCGSALPKSSSDGAADVAQPQHVEEERAVVGRRRDVDRVAAQELADVPAGSVSRANVSSSDDARAERHLELQAARSRARACRARASVNGCRLTRIVPTPSGVSVVDDVVGRMLRTMAMCWRGSVTPSRRSASTASVVVRYISAGRSWKYQRDTLSMPSSVRCDEERRPGLDGVERVLAEHEGAGGGRRPGVDQRDLDGAEALRRARDEAARLVVDEAHARIRSRWPVKSPKRPLTVPMMSLLISTAVTDAGAERQRREHVAPAAGADDERVVAAAQVVADVGDVVLQVRDGCRSRRRSASSPCRPRRRCRAGAGAARVGGTVELRPQPCAGSSRRGSPHHPHARVPVPLLVERPRLSTTPFE